MIYFVYESQLIKNNFVEKTVDELENNKLCLQGVFRTS